MFDDMATQMTRTMAGFDLAKAGIDPCGFSVKASGGMHMQLLLEVGAKVAPYLVERDLTLHVAPRAKFATCDVPVLYDQDTLRGRNGRTARRRRQTLIECVQTVSQGRGGECVQRVSATYGEVPCFGFGATITELPGRWLRTSPGATGEQNSPASHVVAGDRWG